MVIGPRSGVRNRLFLREPLDEGEDVVPAAAIEADDVIAQLIEDLVHLERGRQRLDQDRRLDRAFGSPSLCRANRNTSFHSRASRWLSIFGR